MNNNFSLQSSLEANYLNIQIEDTTKLDEIAIKVVNEDCPEFLIPFKIININDSVTLKYKLINTIALEYANMTLPKSAFVELYLNLLTPFVKGKDWFLDYHNICIDPQYIFLDKHSNKAFFVYVPDSTYQNSNETIIEFFKKIFNSITITDDQHFQIILYRYFSGGQVTLAGLYKIFMDERSNGKSVKKENAKSVVKEEIKSEPRRAAQEIKNPEAVVNSDKKAGFFDGFGKSKKNSDAPEDMSWSQSMDDDVMNAMFGNNNKKKKQDKVSEESKEKGKNTGNFLDGLFGSKKKEMNTPGKTDNSVIAQKSPKPELDLMSPDITEADGFDGGQASEETEIFTESSNSNITAFLELIESALPGAPEQISLGFAEPTITIGRYSTDELKPDIAFPADFKRIGRRHALFKRQGNELYVVDLGSSNHTLLNGRILVPNQPYRLQDGMELTFTDSKPVKYRVCL